MSEFFLKIVNMSISASWLVLAVLVLRLVLKKTPKWVSVLLWGFVAIRLICPFSIESVLSLIPSAETISPEIMMDWTPEVSTGIGALDTVVNPIITESFAPKPYASANPLQILIPVWGNLWILGILIMLAYTAVSYILLRRKVATAVLLRNNIYQSENVDSPFVLGMIRPKIYLPFQMDGQNLQHVIAHEESHIRRKDHWWKPFGFVLLALHWFNPLMWLGYVLLCRDIELACDEKVIKEMDNETKANYTQALVACSVNRRSIAACPLAFGEVGVKERVKSVMNYKKPAFWIIAAAIVTCIVVAVCFLTDPIPNTLKNIEHNNHNKEYTEQWLDKETAEKYDNNIFDHIVITDIYSNCFFAKTVIPTSWTIKLNGALSDDWCVGDQITCTYENTYYDSESNRVEVDFLTVEASDWEPEPGVAYKPVIYLYPKEETDVSVKLILDGKLTCTYPAYNTGWKVTAAPDGTLTDAKGQTYNYLYWEGETKAQWDMTKGFCVKGEDTAIFLEQALEKQGLNRKEANEFIVYWLPLMEQNPYNIISFQTDIYTDAAKLLIDPAPDSLIRVFMAWKATDNFVEIAEQELTAPERTGFTVVEWGGTEVK